MSEGGVAAELRKIFKDWWDKRDFMSLDHLKQEADRIEKDVLVVLANHEPKTRIRVLNDTSKELVIRRPPTAHKVQPQKMMLEFVEGNEALLKIWDGNVVLLSKDELDGGVEAT